MEVFEFCLLLFQKGKLRLKVKKKKTTKNNCGKNSRAKIFSLGIALMMPCGNSSVAFRLFFSFIQNPLFGCLFQNHCGFIHGIKK